MATAEGLAEVIARSNEALAETLAKAFQGLKFTRAPKLKLSKFTGSPARPGDPTLGEWVEELDSYCWQLDLTREERIGVALDHLGGVAKEEILCFYQGSIFGCKLIKRKFLGLTTNKG